jgi:PAS domain S-box-containing protein
VISQDMEQNNGIKTSHETIERFEKLFFMLLDAIPSSVLMINKEMRIVMANRNFLEKSKLSPHKTIGCRLEEVFPAVILDQMNITPQIRQVFETNRSTRGQRMSYRAPGVPMRIYYYRILPFSWQDTVGNVILLMDDLTEQVHLSEEIHRVERHLASVFVSASDMILSTDKEGRILSWNPAAENISGYSFQEVKGCLFFEYLAKQNQEDAKEIFSRMRQDEQSRMVEWILVTKKGKNACISFVCSPIKDENSKTVGIVAVGRDLTERRKLETQFIQAQKLAALGVMAGGIAHEIRNPLAICSSAAQFLMEDEITYDFRKECAEKIRICVDRASLIIENLLKFSRPSVKASIESIDINALIEESITLIINEAKIHNICIRTKFPKKHVTVKGNASLLQQVFINLFLNSIKAMPEGGELIVSIEKEKGQSLVHVTDTGCGILRNDVENIFDPFYTTSPIGKGIGLGLSICYSIMEHFGGYIDVDSDPGKGSTFTVRLPVT